MIYPRNDLGDVIEAIFQKKFALAKILLSRRANIDLTNGFSTPLYRVVSVFHDEALDVVEFLLESGADPNHAQGYSQSPTTVLFLAGGHNLLEAMKLLLKYGGNPNLIVGGTTCLHISSINPRVEMLQLLLDYGADFSIKDDKGKLPLDYFQESWDYRKQTYLMFNGFENESTIRQMLSSHDSNSVN